MKNTFTLGLAAAFVATLSAAEPKDALKGAAKKLADKPNYSWTSTFKMGEGDQEFPGPKGKIEKDGFAVLTQEFRESTWEAVLKGDKGVVKTDEGWKTGDELGPPGPPGQGGRPTWTWILRRLLETKPPAKEAGELLEKIPDLKAGEAGLYSGDLTEEAAKEFLSFGRRPRPGQEGPPPPKNAKGSVKFWVKDGLLTKYAVFLQGTIRFGQDQEERDIATTRTTEIKEVGTTKVEVPEEAKKKF